VGEWQKIKEMRSSGIVAVVEEDGTTARQAKSFDFSLSGK